ncbi:UDP-N-acetylglucosamine 2-epimerase [Candidatus Micrarchaeota archaeon]|nr:UDP-N-acetylglucosamine 2-epimerase [Candidatus Micrarchaeota archaeon]
MPKILFIPSSLNQFKKFLQIMNKLPDGFTHTTINIDKFRQTFTMESIKSSKVDFIAIESITNQSVRNMIKEQNPSLIILGNDTDITPYIFAVESKKIGIPVLLIQDGTLSFKTVKKPLDIGYAMDLFKTYTPKFLLGRILAKLKRSKGPKLSDYGCYSDYIAVWGEYARNQLIERGSPPEKIIVTGSPSIDFVLKQQIDKNRIFQSLKADPEKKTIFFAASDMIGARLWTRDEFENTIKQVCNAVNNMDEVQLIIKIHPFHQGREPKFMEKFVDGKKIFDGGIVDTTDLLQLCDILITDVSTSALEAMAIGKNVAIINLTSRSVSEPYPDIYITDGVAFLINNEEQVETCLNRILYDNELRDSLAKKRNEFVKEQLFRLDGKSSERVVDLIIKIIENRFRIAN